MWQKALYFILASLMERRRGKRKFPKSFHTSRGKRNCVIPKVIELAQKWSWLRDFIMMIILQFVELSRVSFSQSNSASHKESLLQWESVPLPENSPVKHLDSQFSLYPVGCCRLSPFGHSQEIR